MTQNSKYVMSLIITHKETGEKRYYDTTVDYPLSRVRHVALSLAEKYSPTHKVEANLYEWVYVPDGECVSQDLVLVQQLIK